MATGEARNVATPDIDADGDLDLYVVRDGTNPNLADLLLRNRGSGTFDSFIVGRPRPRGSPRWPPPSTTTETAATQCSWSTRTTAAPFPARSS